MGDETAGISFLKGHGTENDFVIVPDPDGTLLRHLDEVSLSDLAAAICDRRAGLGADGLIRAVRCEASEDPDAVAARGTAAWFMDYRNADGSLSQMCGNGIRLLGRYLADHQGADVSAPLPVATRDGIKTLTFEANGDVTVDMGVPRLLGESTVAVSPYTWPAVHVSMGNPHAVAFVDDLAEAGSLLRPPVHDAVDFPQGVNVEFVLRRGERHVAMRVHERGSGETRSCGTGACAVMVATAVADGVDAAAPSRTTYRVDVPGGRLDVTWTEDGHVLLTGPAVLVASGNWG